MRSEADVLVIGAGVAGLSAAAELRRLGLRPIVLEAASRIGGRAFTRKVWGDPFDYGASWLHDAGRNPLVPIAMAYGDPVRDSDGVRARRVQVRQRRASALELTDYAAFQELFETEARRRAAVAPDISFAMAMAPYRGYSWAGTVQTWEATLIAAADPEDFSLADWWMNELDGSNRTVEGGIGAFVARRLGPPAGRVELDTRVTVLDWRGPIIASSSRGSITARAAIVTVSTGVLAAGGIAFSPALPGRTLSAIAGLPMGLLTKVVLRASGLERLDLPADCSLQRQVPYSEPAMFFHASPAGRDHVIGFVGGPAAWVLAREGAAATEAFARAQWRLLLGGKADAVLGEAVATEWGTDPNHLGAYAYARTGHAGARAALGEALAEGRLRFAGEAVCTDGLAGTVGGAFLSGRQAARDIAALLLTA